MNTIILTDAEVLALIEILNNFKTNVVMMTNSINNSLVKEINELETKIVLQSIK